MNITLNFFAEKETKGAVRFKEVDESGADAFTPSDRLALCAQERNAGQQDPAESHHCGRGVTRRSSSRIKPITG